MMVSGRLLFGLILNLVGVSFLIFYRPISAYLINFLPINTKNIQDYMRILGSAWGVVTYHQIVLPAYQITFIIFGLIALAGEQALLEYFSDYEYLNLLIIVFRIITFTVLIYIIYKSLFPN